MNIQVTGHAQKEAWRAGVMPPVEQLNEWLWSIPVPIPNSPLRYVNIYVIRADAGYVLIDTGWPDEGALAALRAGLTQIGTDISEISGVLITHAHPDHYGLVARVRELSGAWISVHEAELAMIGDGGDGAVIRQLQVDYLVGAGAPRNLAELSSGSDADWQKFAGMPVPDRTFADGDMVIPERGVRAIWTPGHSPGHACFFLTTESLLISGDHLLPRITPNITARIIGGDVPLAQYLDSLEQVRKLSVTEVLPGHEYRFSGHQARIDYLSAHHLERLTEVEALVGDNPGINTWELTSQLKWSRPWSEMQPGQWGFALGETLSHLDLLRHRTLVASGGRSGHAWSVTGP